MMSDGDSSNNIIEPCPSNSSIYDQANHPIRIFPAADHYHNQPFLQMMISANHPEFPWLQIRAAPTSCNDQNLHSFLSSSSSSCIKSRLPAASSPKPAAAGSSNHQSDLDNRSLHENNLQSLTVTNEDANCCRLITNCLETLPDHYCDSERLRYLSALIDEDDAGQHAGSFRNHVYASFEYADHRALSMASGDWLDAVPLMREQSLTINEGNELSDSNPLAAQFLTMHNADHQSDPAPGSPAQLFIRDADDLMYPLHQNDSMIINAGDDFLQLLQPCINNNNPADHLLINEVASAAAPTNHRCSDLEEVLDILLEKVECSASAQTASPSISPSIITSNYGGLSINDAAITHKRSSEVALVSPHSSQRNMKDRDGELADFSWQQKQAEARAASWQEKYQGEDVRASWQQFNQAGEDVRASWQQDEAGEIRASWQQQQKEVETRVSWQQNQAGEIRASWQHIQPREIRARWNQHEDGEARATWQQKPRARWQENQEGEIRASWQQKQGSSEQGEGVHLTQQQQADEGSKDYNSSLNAFMQSCSKEYMSINASSTSKAGATTWAGPTLTDIQIALASSGGSPINHTTATTTTSANTSTDDSSSASLTLHQEEAQPAQEKTTFLTDEVALLCKDDLEQAHKLNDSWRARLQKRGNIGPKYTVRVSSEEEAARDGYRWRKYGQKSIKNSPFPRCYYKCTSGNCLVKKQVERCTKDSRIFVVTYEGLHVHTRPDVCHVCASSSKFPHSQCQSTL